MGDAVPSIRELASLTVDGVERPSEGVVNDVDKLRSGVICTWPNTPRDGIGSVNSVSVSSYFLRSSINTRELELFVAVVIIIV